MLHGAASGQETGQPPPILYDESVTVTAERTPLNLDESTRSVSIIPQQEILDRVSRTVPEALRYEQGILVQRTNLGAGAPIVRGMVGNQVLTLIDGIRLNNSTFRGGPNQYLNTIDPFFIDQIEVVRGPGSVLYGSDALGGTINIITKRRTDFSDKVDIDGRLMGRATTGEMEQTGHLDVDANATSVFGMALSGNFRKFGDIDPGGREPPEQPYGYESQDFAGNFDFHLGNHVTLEFAAQHVGFDNVPNYDPVNPKNLFETQRRNLYYAKLLAIDLSDYLDHITLFASYHRQEEAREKITATAPDLETRDHDVVRSLGAGLQMETPIDRWVRFVYGTEVYFDDLYSFRERSIISSGQVQEVASQYPDGSTYLSVAGYLETRITPTDWLKLVPGVRYSLFQPDIQMDDPTLGDIRVTDSIDDWTWSFHSLFNVARHHGIILGASRGFRTPSIDDLTKLGSEDGRYDIPNENLEPESMIQYELGYRATHPHAFFSLFGYYSQIEDLIVRTPATYEGQTQIGADRIHQNRNVGEAYIYGVECTGKLVALDGFFSAGGSIAYTFGQNETDDEPMRRIPPLMGSAWSRINFSPKYFELA